MKNKNGEATYDRRSILKGAGFLSAATAAALTMGSSSLNPAYAAGPAIATGSKASTRSLPVGPMPKRNYGHELGLAIPAYDIMWKTASQRRRTIDLIKSTGVEWVRTDLWLDSLTWAGPDQIDWATSDAVINDLTARGIRLILVVHTLPKYAGVPNPRTGPTTQKQRDIYINFMKKAVARYKSKVHHWEIWNEPNLVEFWNKPNAHDYGMLLKQVYPAIKKIDPSAVVISGGTGGKGRDADIDAIKFLKQLYTSGMLKNYSDAIGIHAYADLTQRNNLGEFWRLSEYRSVLNSFGDTRKHIWITEGGAIVRPGHPVATEANQLDMTSKVLKAWYNTPYHGILSWFTLYDTYGGGLIRTDGTPRPAFEKFKQMSNMRTPWR